MNNFFYYTKDYKISFILSVVAIEVETFFELLIPLLLASIIDIGVANRDSHYILVRGSEMVLCALAAMAFGQIYARMVAKFGSGVGASLRAVEFRKLQTYSFANTDKFSTSSLVTRLTSDVNTIQNSIINGMRPAFRSPLMLLMALAIAIKLNAKLALVFIVASPILGLILFFIVKNVRPLYQKMQETIDLLNLTIQENVAAVRVVKAYVRGDYEVDKFDKVNHLLQENSQKAFGLAVLNMPAFQLVMYATILSLLAFGGQLVIAEKMEVGSLTSFLSYILQVLNSLMMLSSAFLLFTRSLISWHRIQEVLDEEPTIKDIKSEENKITCGKIQFKDVSFKYSKEASQEVLSTITFTIYPGQTIGIIGPTGSGKSSLVQLILRLYEASSGRILIDDEPIETYTQAHLRDKIGIVLQKNTLFTGSLVENLKWGNEAATEKEIQEVCRLACVDEFVERLEKGYQTQLGQGGVNLSGGQKQRLCIARTLLKKPKVLILDDSTSALDTATEAKLKKGLDQELTGMTKIIIAQRISSVESCDQIIVMNNGRIDAMGNHEELIKENDIYQEIYQTQKQGGRIE